VVPPDAGADPAETPRVSAGAPGRWTLDPLRVSHLFKSLIGEKGRRGKLPPLLDAIARGRHGGEKADETDSDDDAGDEDFCEGHARLVDHPEPTRETDHLYGLVTRPVSAMEMVLVWPVVELVMV
jgi:hypothetical protein